MPERQTEPITETERIVGRQIVSLYRSWHAMEGGKIDGIDFDLVRDDYPTIAITSRSEVVKRLESLHQEISPVTPFLEFARAKLTASATFLRSLEGQPFSLEDYASKTVGIWPELISDMEIKSQKENADKALSRLRYEPNPEGYIRFFEENLLDQKQIGDDFNTARDRLIPMIVSSLGLSHLLPLDYQQNFVEKDEYWICWIKGNRSGMEFNVNLHSRNRKRWFKGSPEIMALHEMGGHLVQALNWKNLLENGQINPGYGTTSIPGPEQWACEGMAQAMPIIIPDLYDNLSDFGKFAFEISRLNDLVMNNVHIVVNEDNGDHRIDDIKHYVHQFLPHETDERIEKTIIDRSQNPFHRAYLLTYSDGGRFFNKTAQRLGEKTTDLTRVLYHVPMTPDQIKRLVSNLENS